MIKEFNCRINIQRFIININGNNIHGKCLMTELYTHLLWALFVCSFLFSNQLWIRALVIIFSIISLGLGSIPYVWPLLLILINGGYLVKLLLHQRKMFLNSWQKYLYEQYFEGLSHIQFHQLLKCIELKPFASGEQLIKEGTTLSEFYFLYEGQVKILRAGKFVSNVGHGHFLGELSFLTGNLTNADVELIDDSKIICFDVAKMGHLFAEDMVYERAINKALSSQLVDYILDHDDVMFQDPA